MFTDIECSVCGENIDVGKKDRIQTGCSSYTSAAPCSKCELMHFADGNKVMTRSSPQLGLYFIDGQYQHLPVPEPQSISQN